MQERRALRDALRGALVLAAIASCTPPVTTAPATPPTTRPAPTVSVSVSPPPAPTPEPAAAEVEEPREVDSLPRYVPMPNAPPAPNAQPAPGAQPAQPDVPAPTPAEQKACAARGGKIEPVCMLGELMCVIRYRDGGKRCVDKRDCTGECLYEGPTPAPAKPVGACQRTSDPCGCKAPIVNGKVAPAMCVD
jgi:hypothetical protein